MKRKLLLLSFLPIFLFFFSNKSFSQDLERVLIRWQENGDLQISRYNYPGETKTINRDPGTEVGLTIYKSSSASSQVEYYYADVNNSRSDFVTSTNDYIKFDDVAGPNDTELRAGITGGTGGHVTFRILNIVPQDPDLVVSNITVEGTTEARTYEVGERVEIDAYVFNNGESSAGSSRLGFYYSNSKDDLEDYLGYDFIGSLDKGYRQNGNEYYTFEISDIGQGKYFVLKADDRNEVDEGGNEENNIASFGPFEVQGIPMVNTSPELRNPSDGAIFSQGQDISFKWGTVENATAYQIQFNAQNPFEVNEPDFTNQFNESGIFNWKVRGINNSGEGPWSGERSFEIEEQNETPIAKASDISGQPAEVIANQTFTVRSEYYDKNGRRDLKLMYLRLYNPGEGSIELIWDNETKEIITNNSFDYFSINPEVDVTSIDDNGLEGYELTWEITINKQWPEVTNGIDLAVLATDQANKTSSESREDSNISFKHSLNDDITPPKVEVLRLFQVQGPKIKIYVKITDESNLDLSSLKFKIRDVDASVFGKDEATFDLIPVSGFPDLFEAVAEKPGWGNNFSVGTEVVWKIKAADEYGNVYDYPSEYELGEGLFDRNLELNNDGWASRITIVEEGKSLPKTFVTEKGSLSGAFSYEVDGNDLKLLNNTTIWYSMSINPKSAENLIDLDEYRLYQEILATPKSGIIHFDDFFHDRSIVLRDGLNQYDQLEVRFNRKTIEATFRNIFDMVASAANAGSSLPKLDQKKYAKIVKAIYKEIEIGGYLQNLANQNYEDIAVGVTKFLLTKTFEEILKKEIELYLRNSVGQAVDKAAKEAAKYAGNFIDIIFGINNRLGFLIDIWKNPFDTETIKFIRTDGLKLDYKTIPGYAYNEKAKPKVGSNVNSDIYLYLPSALTQPYFGVYADIKIFDSEGNNIEESNLNGGNIEVGPLNKDDIYEQGTYITPNALANDKYVFPINFSYSFSNSSKGHSYISNRIPYYYQLTLYEGGYPGLNILPTEPRRLYQTEKIPFQLSDNSNSSRPSITNISISETSGTLSVTTEIDFLEPDIEFVEFCWSYDTTFFNNCSQKALSSDEFSLGEVFYSKPLDFSYDEFFIKTRTIDLGGNKSNFSNSQSIKLTNATPTIIIETGPADGSSINFSDPTFTWSGNDSDGSVVDYEVELTGPTPDSFTTPDDFHQFSDLLYGDYVFRVRAIDNEDAESNWKERSFTVNVTQESTLSVSPSSLSFGEIVVSTNSSVKSYTINGTNLTNNVSVSAPVGFQVSKSSNAGFSNSLSVSQSGGNVDQKIYVRFSPASVKGYSSEISNSSSGVVTENVSVSGTGIQDTGDVISISVSVLPEGSGEVQGAQSYEVGNTVTLEATAYTDFVFNSWTEDGAEVSKQNPWSFTAENDRTLVANFESKNVQPEVKITSGPSEGSTINYDDPIFSWSGNDGDGTVVEYEVELQGPSNSGTQKTISENLSLSGLSDGSYTFSVRAIDDKGAMSDWATRTFNVDTSSPEVNFASTTVTYTENDDLELACTDEFGSSASLADWTDIETYYQENGSLAPFFETIKLDEENGKNMLVQRSGNRWYSSSRHYFMTRHDGNKPSGYLAHENINNYELSLGSWYGLNYRVLCKGVQNQIPTVSIENGPEDGETIKFSDPAFVWSGNDSDGSVTGYEVELQGPSSTGFSTAETSHQFSDLTNGNYTFRVRAIDNDGDYSDWDERSFTVEVVEVVIVSYPKGWNLVSIPKDVTGKSISDYFPSVSAEDVFKFEGQYVGMGSLSLGIGYWVKLDEEREVEYSGNIINSLAISLNQGWNLIGTVAEELNTATDILDQNNILEGKTVWKARKVSKNEYELVETSQMQPGRAYFIKAIQSGEIILEKQ